MIDEMLHSREINTTLISFETVTIQNVQKILLQFSNSP